MNIKRAKQEIKDTVAAYLAKDEFGAYEIPSIRQRPMLLIGPPGIGKTQIMEQAAQECGIGLVAYTITHHTRQSAVGLPFIEHKMYGGKEYAVTEYTMSEIVASVYDRIEKSGLPEQTIRGPEQGSGKTLLSWFLPRGPMSAYDQAILAQANIIRKLAEEGPCIIVGRGADYILRDREDVLNVVLYADQADKLAYAMDT